MALLDFGRNRYSVSNSGGSTETKAHPPVRMGLFRSSAGSYTDARPVIREMQGATGLNIRVVGSRFKASGAPHSGFSFGMPWSGRLTVSNFVYPSGFTPRVIIVM